MLLLCGQGYQQLLGCKATVDHRTVADFCQSNITITGGTFQRRHTVTPKIGQLRVFIDQRWMLMMVVNWHVV